MADNNQASNNTQSSQQTQNAAQGSNSVAAANEGWVTVDTSTSAEAQRMNIMKGNENQFSTKSGK